MYAVEKWSDTRAGVGSTHTYIKREGGSETKTGGLTIQCMLGYERAHMVSADIYVAAQAEELKIAEEEEQKLGDFMESEALMARSPDYWGPEGPSDTETEYNEEPNYEEIMDELEQAKNEQQRRDEDMLQESEKKAKIAKRRDTSCYSTPQRTKPKNNNYWQHGAKC